LEQNVTPAELSVGLSKRRPDDPVLAVLQRARMNPRSFINPADERPRSAVQEFLTPESGFEARGGAAGPQQYLQERSRRSPRIFRPWAGGGGVQGSPMLGMDSNLRPINAMQGGQGIQGFAPPRFSPAVQQFRMGPQLGNPEEEGPGEHAGRRWYRGEELGGDGETMGWQGGLIEGMSGR
jgi:hypothetical protein